MNNDQVIYAYSKERNILLKKLIHRSKNRGMKELDMILGFLADNFLDTFKNEKLRLYLRILEEISDNEIYLRLINGKNYEKDKFTDLLNEIIEFYVMSNQEIKDQLT